MPRSSVSNAKICYDSTAESVNFEDSVINDRESDKKSSEISENEEAVPFFKKLPRNAFSFSIHQILGITILCAANLCSTIAFSCIAPFYPAEAKLQNLSETQTGVVFGIFELTMFIISPLFGKYITVLGARTMFIGGIVLTGVTSILFGFLIYLPSGISFFWFTVLVRILQAVGDAAFVTSSFSIAAKMFPMNVAVLVGILETFGGLGCTVGPVIGGFFYDIGGFPLPFLVLGGVLLVASVLAFFLIENSKSENAFK